MTNNIVVYTACAALVLGGLASSATADKTHEGHTTAATAAKGTELPNIKGEVKKVDTGAGKVTIKHDAIPNLDMDGMTMVFRAADPSLLNGLNTGDKVNFQADKVNGQITVVKIEKAK
jgi:Cu/Ag efflux protein CusF